MAFILIDILILGAVAAFLFFRLRGVLGQKHGEERTRPNPYSAKKEADAPAKDDNISDEAENQDNVFNMPDRDRRDIFVDSAPNRKLESALTKIALADQNFEPMDFMEGAKVAFEMIVEAYAKGDLETLEALLGKDLYETFAQGVKQREKSGHNATTEILGIKQAHIIDASLKQNTARITIRFVTDETRFIEDKNGKIISGDPGAIHQTRDVWTFERAVNSKSPNWLLIETQSEDD